jgi:hypothetical protein
MAVVLVSDSAGLGASTAMTGAYPTAESADTGVSAAELPAALPDPVVPAPASERSGAIAGPGCSGGAVGTSSGIATAGERTSAFGPTSWRGGVATLGIEALAGAGSRVVDGVFLSGAEARGTDLLGRETSATEVVAAPDLGDRAAARSLGADWPVTLSPTCPAGAAPLTVTRGPGIAPGHGRSALGISQNPATVAIPNPAAIAIAPRLPPPARLPGSAGSSLTSASARRNAAAVSKRWPGSGSRALETTDRAASGTRIALPDRSPGGSPLSM